MTNRIREIKQAQRASFLLHEIAQFFLQITIDDAELRGLYINRVKLSSDNGLCYVLFIATNGKEEFDAKLSRLILFKPSLRSALSKVSHGRYVPDLIFKYDEEYEKQQKVEDLIDQLKREGKI